MAREIPLAKALARNDEDTGFANKACTSLFSSVWNMRCQSPERSGKVLPARGFVLGVRVDSDKVVVIAKGNDFSHLDFTRFSITLGCDC